jgi:lipopolysaccharide/colanic/teichoic acid biosynthesis glycosyltransferase
MSARSRSRKSPATPRPSVATLALKRALDVLGSTVGRVILSHAGAFLRRTKLDELPQLINVLKGEMSLVGPRPELPEFLNFYTPEQRAIIVSLRPGTTDYAAILFRDESSLLDGKEDPIEIYRHGIMPIKFAYYERYSHDIGFINDLRNFAATVWLLAFKHVPESFGIEHELLLTKRQ